MDKSTLGAIIAISVIIPLSILAVRNSAESTIPLQDIAIEKKFVILSSHYTIYEFASEVGGDKVDVSLLVPSGVEPHDWEPSFNDLQRIQKSDMIVINGIGFENWVNNVVAVNSNIVIVDSSSGISTLKGVGKSFEDPHIWLNPVMAKKQVDNIANALAKIDSSNAEYYTNNANSYTSKLDSLDFKIKKELSDCKKRDFISFHSAFSYFASQYGLNQHTIIDSNQPYVEPTSVILEQVISLAKELEIKIIFTEEGVDTRIADVVASEIGGKVSLLSPLEVIDDAQTSYIKKMEQNLSNLKEALCD